MAVQKQKRDDYYEHLLAHPAEATFEEFFRFYAATKSEWKNIPDFHFDLIDFLSEDEEWPDDVAVVQCFRNAAKSTIVAPWVVWKLVRNPSLHVMIQSADDRLAKKMVRDCKGIVRTHPLAKHLYSPELIWTAKEFDVVGNKDDRSFSCASYSIGATPTGSRAHLIIYDDVEVPKNSRTAELRSELREKIAETVNTLHAGGKRLRARELLDLAALQDQRRGWPEVLTAVTFRLGATCAGTTRRTWPTSIRPSA